MVDYVFTGYDPQLARLGVRWKGTPFPEWLWLPISDDGFVPEGDELHNWIMLHRPEPMIERSNLIAEKGVKNEAAIISLVPPPPDPGPAPDPVEEAKRMAELMEPGFVYLLKKYGLIKAE